MKLLVFGSSHRRGARGWSDPAPIAAVFSALRPDHVGHGKSPSGGADAVADGVARDYFAARGLVPGEHVWPYPMEPAKDGQGGGAFIRRRRRAGLRRGWRLWKGR